MNLLSQLREQERSALEAERAESKKKAAELELAREQYQDLVLRAARRDAPQDGDDPEAVGELLATVGKGAQDLERDVAALRMLMRLASEIDPAAAAVEEALAGPGHVLALAEKKRIEEQGKKLVRDALNQSRRTRIAGAQIREKAHRVLQATPPEVARPYYAALRDVDAAKGRLALRAVGGAKGGRALAAASVEDLQGAVRAAGEKVGSTWAEIVRHVGEGPRSGT